MLIVSADSAVPAAESDQWLVFEVTDTGCGISQRGLASLFTEYVQVSVVHPITCPMVFSTITGPMVLHTAQRL